MKKCYINPQIVAYKIHTRSLMDDTSQFGGGGGMDEDEGWAKGFYGSWEADDDEDE